MKVLPSGISRPKAVVVKLHPIPKITSASSRNLRTARVVDRPAEPRASGCASSKALLPPKLVVTGAFSSSASSRNSGQALA